MFQLTITLLVAWTAWIRNRLGDFTALPRMIAPPLTFTETVHLFSTATSTLRQIVTSATSVTSAPTIDSASQCLNCLEQWLPEEDVPLVQPQPPLLSDDEFFFLSYLFIVATIIMHVMICYFYARCRPDRGRRGGDGGPSRHLLPPPAPHDIPRGPSGAGSTGPPPPPGSESDDDDSLRGDESLVAQIVVMTEQKDAAFKRAAEAELGKGQHDAEIVFQKKLVEIQKDRVKELVAIVTKKSVAVSDAETEVLGALREMRRARAETEEMRREKMAVEERSQLAVNQASVQAAVQGAVQAAALQANFKNKAVELRKTVAKLNEQNGALQVQVAEGTRTAQALESPNKGLEGRLAAAETNAPEEHEREKAALVQELEGQKSRTRELEERKKALEEELAAARCTAQEHERAKMAPEEELSAAGRAAREKIEDLEGDVDDLERDKERLKVRLADSQYATREYEEETVVLKRKAGEAEVAAKEREEQINALERRAGEAEAAAKEHERQHKAVKQQLEESQKLASSAQLHHQALEKRQSTDLTAMLNVANAQNARNMSLHKDLAHARVEHKKEQSESRATTQALMAGLQHAAGESSRAASPAPRLPDATPRTEPELQRSAPAGAESTAEEPVMSGRAGRAASESPADAEAPGGEQKLPTLERVEPVTEKTTAEETAAEKTAAEETAAEKTTAETAAEKMVAEETTVEKTTAETAPGKTTAETATGKTTAETAAEKTTAAVTTPPADEERRGLTLDRAAPTAEETADSDTTSPESSPKKQTSPKANSDSSDLDGLERAMGDFSFHSPPRPATKRAQLGDALSDAPTPVVLQETPASDTTKTVVGPVPADEVRVTQESRATSTKVSRAETAPSAGQKKTPVAPQETPAPDAPKTVVGPVPADEGRVTHEPRATSTKVSRAETGSSSGQKKTPVAPDTPKTVVGPVPADEGRVTQEPRATLTKVSRAETVSSAGQKEKGKGKEAASPDRGRARKVGSEATAPAAPPQTTTSEHIKAVKDTASAPDAKGAQGQERPVTASAAVTAKGLAPEQTGAASAPNEAPSSGRKEMGKGKETASPGRGGARKVGSEATAPAAPPQTTTSEQTKAVKDTASAPDVKVSQGQWKKPAPVSAAGTAKGSAPEQTGAASAPTEAPAGAPAAEPTAAPSAKTTEPVDKPAGEVSIPKPDETPAADANATTETKIMTAADPAAGEQVVASSEPVPARPEAGQGQHGGHAMEYAAATSAAPPLEPVAEASRASPHSDAMDTEEDGAALSRSPPRNRTPPTQMQSEAAPQDSGPPQDVRMGSESPHASFSPPQEDQEMTAPADGPQPHEMQEDQEMTAPPDVAQHNEMQQDQEMTAPPDGPQPHEVHQDQEMTAPADVAQADEMEEDPPEWYEPADHAMGDFVPEQFPVVEEDEDEDEDEEETEDEDESDDDDDNMEFENCMDRARTHPPSTAPPTAPPGPPASFVTQYSQPDTAPGRSTLPHERNLPGLGMPGAANPPSPPSFHMPAPYVHAPVGHAPQRRNLPGMGILGAANPRLTPSFHTPAAYVPARYTPGGHAPAAPAAPAGYVPANYAPGGYAPAGQAPVPPAWSGPETLGADGTGAPQDQTMAPATGEPDGMAWSGPETRGGGGTGAPEDQTVALAIDLVPTDEVLRSQPCESHNTYPCAECGVECGHRLLECAPCAALPDPCIHFLGDCPECPKCHEHGRYACVPCKLCYHGIYDCPECNTQLQDTVDHNAGLDPAFLAMLNDGSPPAPGFVPDPAVLAMVNDAAQAAGQEPPLDPALLDARATAGQAPPSGFGIDPALTGEARVTTDPAAEVDLSPIKAWLRQQAASESAIDPALKGETGDMLDASGQQINPTFTPPAVPTHSAAGPAQEAPRAPAQIHRFSYEAPTGASNFDFTQADPATDDNDVRGYDTTSGPYFAPPPPPRSDDDNPRPETPPADGHGSPPFVPSPVPSSPACSICNTRTHSGDHCNECIEEKAEADKREQELKEATEAALAADRFTEKYEVLNDSGDVVRRIATAKPRLPRLRRAGVEVPPLPESAPMLFSPALMSERLPSEHEEKKKVKGKEADRTG